ncbi:hypothetical protein AAY81_06830 [Denitrobacterium detoxificans]|uniref:Regulatory protein, luxR family n=1 Tax=Denitrobacterium detoxificans TaxID=79604 RepID=A0A172RZ38_9ACTN|nr:LuxR family transcriptional regulator [Denitrobacterium detoxificans]ANE22883.1 hypothetical protein AAY81_06830 [Denitrobacterium detoxificans]SEO70398.1 regulatory protein, luxR family [Denitrobacterium detoxificans]
MSFAANEAEDVRASASSADSGTSSAGKAGSFLGSAPRIRAILRDFSWAFLGLAAVRIWIQCTIYDRYAFTDAGLTSVVINASRVILTAIVIAFILKCGFPRNARRILSWFSVSAMTLGSVLFLVDAQLHPGTFDALACILAGCGLVWGGGQWMEFYLRLSPDESFFYALVSLALGSLGGMVLGYLPERVGAMVSVVMPTVSFAMLAWSLRLTQGRLEEGRLDPAPQDTRYDSEPATTWVRLLLGLAFIEFAMGIARGFPHGSSFELAPVFQTLHQVGVIGISFAGLYIVLVRNRFMRYSTLWCFMLALVAVGIILLTSLNWYGLSLGSTSIAIVNTVMLSVLWFTCYDIARHASVIPYVFLGVVWSVFLLAREAGRIFVMLVPPHDDFVTFIDVLMILALTMSIAVMFTDRIPVKREMFEGLRFDAGKRVLASDVPSAVLASDGPQRVDLVQVYGLTKREAEVIDYLMQGKSKAQVGRELFISENTVRGYVKNAYSKMDVHNKEQLREKYYRS